MISRRAVSSRRKEADLTMAIGPEFISRLFGDIMLKIAIATAAALAFSGSAFAGSYCENTYAESAATTRLPFPRRLRPYTMKSRRSKNRVWILRDMSYGPLS